MFQTFEVKTEHGKAEKEFASRHSIGKVGAKYYRLLLFDLLSQDMQ